MIAPERQVEDVFAGVKRFLSTHRPGGHGELTPPGVEAVRLEDFNLEKATEFIMYRWKGNQVVAKAYGPGRPPEGRIEQLGWDFSQNFAGVEWHLTINNRREVNLSHPGKRELHMGGITKVEFDHNTQQLSFIGHQGRYNIQDEGLVHSTQAADGRIEGPISFKPQPSPAAVVPAA